ncbi:MULTISPECIES: helix-turn-helix domain-containing protein [Arthrobacter]|uniref:Helix-turn-helix domain-containing protein n=2 Tax=Arthrobacter TaxID=1663 RepID=A0ABU9KFX3_9MICC|nr:helix-turn-helix domain-containing protein [Arthrobacter sp. YJM1]MDP5225769.1 helix-turn-helix domain-containing protein [Arthrobacter sp. YJM1]
MTVIRTASDLGKAIRGARIQAGLSQAELARRAGLSRKFIGELESGKETAELGSALRVSEALGLTLRGPDLTPQAVLEDAADAVRGELSRGDADFALRIALDTFRSLESMAPSVLRKPRSTGDPRWDSLLAAGARIALRNSRAKPRWGSRLAEAWFPADDLGPVTDAYRRLTIRRTPKELADFNIFLNDKSLLSA